MIGKPIALIQIPNPAMFSPKAEAQYLGTNVNTLKVLTDLALRAMLDWHLLGHQSFSFCNVN